MQKRRIISTLMVLAIVSLPFVAYAQRYNIYDWYRLYNYAAPDDVAQLATDTTMVPSARRLFYVYKPELEDKKPFNGHCRSDEKTIVLGCYVNHDGIYLLKVTDSRLDGVEQVTAAHETLHAAYARLSSSRRKEIDAMTNKAFLALSDQRVKDNIELYRKQDPKVVPNELHSILGTEVSDLPPDLEAYYKRYFSNRAKVVAYSEQYEQAFTDRKNQIAAYDAELTSLSQQIMTLKAALAVESNDLQTQRNRIDGLKSSNQIAAYNAAVPGFNAQVRKYNEDIDTISALVDQYNDIVPKRNAIVNEEQELTKSLDSRDVVPARQ